MPPTLAQYQTRTLRLVRDTGTLYALTDITDFVNEARHQRDLDTRRVRAVFGLSLTPLQSTYALTAIGGSSVIRGEATTIPRDVIALHILPTGVAGGIGLRYPLSRLPHSRIGWLVSTSWPGYPVAYAMLGTGNVVLAPPPPIAYPAEWDCVGIYPDLVQQADVEPMPDPWNDPVPYLAAALCKTDAQRFDEADQFEARYERRLARIRQGIQTVAIPMPWADLPRSLR